MKKIILLSLIFGLGILFSTNLQSNIAKSGLIAGGAVLGSYITSKLVKSYFIQRNYNKLLQKFPQLQEFDDVAYVHGFEDKFASFIYDNIYDINDITNVEVNKIKKDGQDIGKRIIVDKNRDHLIPIFNYIEQFEIEITSSRRGTFTILPRCFDNLLSEGFSINFTIVTYQPELERYLKVTPEVIQEVIQINDDQLLEIRGSIDHLTRDGDIIIRINDVTAYVAYNYADFPNAKVGAKGKFVLKKSKRSNPFDRITAAVDIISFEEDKEFEIPKNPSRENETLKIKGQIIFEDIEGGHLFIRGADGASLYRPCNISKFPELKTGVKGTFELKLCHNSVDCIMCGTPAEIISYEKDKEFVPPYYPYCVQPPQPSFDKRSS